MLTAPKDKNNVHKRNKIAAICVYRNKFKLSNIYSQTGKDVRGSLHACLSRKTTDGYTHTPKLVATSRFIKTHKKNSGNYVCISTYINTKISVCVCVFTFFSAIWNPIGIPFGTK